MDGQLTGSSCHRFMAGPMRLDGHQRSTTPRPPRPRPSSPGAPIEKDRLLHQVPNSLDLRGAVLGDSRRDVVDRFKNLSYPHIPSGNPQESTQGVVNQVLIGLY